MICPKLSLNYEYIDRSGNPPEDFAFVLSDGSKSPRDFYVGYPDFSSRDFTTQKFGYTFSYEFSDRWQLRNNFSANISDVEEAFASPLSLVDDLFLELEPGDRYSNQTISVAHISDEYGTEAYTVNSFPGSILSDLSLQRPQSQAISKPGGTIEAISEERLELIDGDLLFVLIYADSDRQMLDNLLNKPLWKKLKAVRNGQVAPVDGFTWGVANPLAANAVIDDLYKYLLN